jgi:biotin transporter BioY
VTTLGVTLGVMALLVDRVGIQAAGIGYCASYLLYIVIVGVLAGRSLSWRASRAMLWLTLFGLAATIATGLIGAWAPLVGLLVGGMVTAGMGAFSLHRLLRLDALPAFAVKMLNIVGAH